MYPQGGGNGQGFLKNGYSSLKWRGATNGFESDEDVLPLQGSSSRALDLDPQDSALEVDSPKYQKDNQGPFGWTLRMLRRVQGRYGADQHIASYGREDHGNARDTKGGAHTRETEGSSSEKDPMFPEQDGGQYRHTSYRPWSYNLCWRSQKLEKNNVGNRWRTNCGWFGIFRILAIISVIYVTLLRPVERNLRFRYYWWHDSDLHQEIERRLMASVPQPWKGEHQGIAILINTYQGMEVPTIWERWLSDAMDFVELYEGHRDFKRSKLVRPYVHHMWVFEDNVTLRCLPPLLYDHLIPEPFPCIYNNLNNCTRGLMNAAFHDFPEAEFFVYVSMNTIPLKPFKTMLQDFLADARPRQSIHCPVLFDSQSAKGSGWRMWRRAEIEVMLRRWQEWINVPTSNYAGANEIWTNRVLANEWGQDYYAHLRCSKWIEPGEPACRPVAAEVCPHNIWTYECWETECHGERLSGYLARPPFLYQGIEEAFLNHLIASPDTHFLRKVRESSYVLLEPDVEIINGGPLSDNSIEGPLSGHEKHFATDWDTFGKQTDHETDSGPGRYRRLADRETLPPDSRYMGRKKSLLYEYLSNAMNLTSTYVHPHGAECGSLPVFPIWNRVNNVKALEWVVKLSCVANVKPEYQCLW